TTGGGRILLADGSLATSLERSPAELEERRLFPVEAEEIRRIHLERPEGPLTLSKDGSDWHLLEPIRDTADPGAADGLARSIASLSVSERTDGAAGSAATRAPAKGSSGEGAPIRIEIETTGSAVKRAEIREAKDGGDAKGARADGTLSGPVPASSVKELAKDPKDLRDRRIAILPAEGIRKIRIESGGKTVTASREKED